MNPLTPIAISGGISLLGGLINHASQVSANHTNMDIAKMNQQSVRETNASNEKIADRANAANRSNLEYQNAWNLEQWNRENAYNSPQQQIERLKAAGINPASVFGQVGANNVASALQSGQPAPSEVSYNQPALLDYQKQPYAYDFLRDAAFTAIDAYNSQRQANVDNENKKLQNESLMLDNEFKASSMMDKLLEARNSARKGSVEYEQASENLRLFRDAYEYRLAEMHGNSRKAQRDADLLEERIASEKVSREILEIDRKFRDSLNAEQIRSLRAGVSQALSAARLSNEQAVKTAAEKLVVDLQASGLKIDNSTKHKIQNAVVDKAYEEVYAMEDAREFLPYDKSQQYGGKGYQLLPNPAAQFKSSEVRDRNVRRNRRLRR